MNEREGGVAARVGAKRPTEVGPNPASPAAGARAAAASDRPAPASTAELIARVQAERATLDAELTEIDMLLAQARAEAARHEGKRATAADRLAGLQKSGGDLKEIAEISSQVVTLTRRALVMQAQVDVIEGKLKTLTRFRDSVAHLADDLEDVAAGPGGGEAGGAGSGATDPAAGGRVRSARRGAGADEGAEDTGGSPALPPAVSRMLLTAQEDLRRDIARTMHDGPAQSLTNIVLQAQIVERLLSRDPASAAAEVRQLVSMVQQTLDATKSFIFDVRPMVLDDLGLVPTIRRAARERGRRAQIPVDFESYGNDHRLAMELESGLFRILDETLAAFLASRPDRVTIRLDWADGLEARITARRALAAPAASGPAGAGAAAEAPAPSGGRGRGRGKPAPAEPEAMPAALAAMIDERREAETAARRAVGGLPASTRREIVQRAATLGVAVEILEDGREVRLLVDAASIE